MKAAAEVILTIGHIVTAILGFGAVAVTGAQALVARRNPAATSVKRYFREGPNWIAMSLLLTPLFGGALEVVDNYPDVHRLWPWLALGIWLIAAAVGGHVHWPAEQRIQRSLADAADSNAVGPVFQRASVVAAASSAVMVAAFAGALVVMVTQPG